MTDRRAEIDALLDAALDLQPGDRSAFLASIGDEGLRREVAGLLVFADASTDPIELNARAAVALIDALAEDDGSEWSQQWQALKPKLPDRIGAWRVLDRIGEGGMGEVLKVVRDDAGFQQYGALKMVRAGFADGEFARRFVQERQILARLNHPSIAGLLDGGYDGERHYLVMEFVAGEPIDRYCDRRRLGLAARIDIFVEVARAVAHAHRQLIVHRDLKPSNVLVRGDGHVKLLDFGIAKVLADDGIDPQATLIEQRMFTPEYASPEQARGEAVGTASDVYQLGLLLYELLCGQRAQRVKGSTAAQIERAIVEHVPPPMSRSIDADGPEIAAIRAATPARLKRALRGDLELIVRKAFEKDIERRYASVDALIDDLERSRRGQPLLAKPDTLGYRAWRFLRRHPVGVSFATSTLLLVMGYLVTLWLQSAALERERDRARAEADKARQVQTLVQRLFEGIDPDVSGGANLSVRALLDRSFGDIERELNTQPEVRAELLLTVGDVYFALGEYRRAKELLRQASSLADGFVASEPILAARIYRSLGRIEVIGNDLSVPDRSLTRALELLRANNGSPLELAACLYQLAELRRRQDRWSEAQALSHEALTLRRANLPSNHADRADSLIQSASISRRLGDLAQAEASMREALGSMQIALPATHPRLAETRADLASLLRTQGRRQESEAMFREAIAGLDKSRGDQHPFLGIVLNNHGNLLLELGKSQEAEATQRRALDIQLKAHGDVHPRVALAWNSLGKALRAQQRSREAISSFQSALSALPKTHQAWRASFLRNLAIAQLEIGDCAGLLDTVLQFEQFARSSSQRAVALRLRAECLLKLGRDIEALASVDAALALFKNLPDDSLERAEAERLSGDIHLIMNDHDAARAAFSRSDRVLRGLSAVADAARERLARSVKQLPDQGSEVRATTK